MICSESDEDKMIGLTRRPVSIFLSRSIHQTSLVSACNHTGHSCPMFAASDPETQQGHNTVEVSSLWRRSEKMRDQGRKGNRCILLQSKFIEKHTRLFPLLTRTFRILRSWKTTRRVLTVIQHQPSLPSWGLWRALPVRWGGDLSSPPGTVGSPTTTRWVHH